MSIVPAIEPAAVPSHEPRGDAGDRSDVRPAGEPLDGSTQREPLDGSTQREPLDGSTQREPLDGSTQGEPLDGSTFLREELDDCRAKLQLLSDLGSTVVYVFDLERGVTKWVSTDIRGELGYDPAEIAQMGDLVIHTLVHPEDLGAVMAHTARWPTTADGVILEAEFRLRDKQGGWRWFGSRETIRARRPDGRPAEILGIAFDVSARRELAEQSLRVAKLEALGRLAGGIAHDFNNLLTVVMGNVALARSAIEQQHDASAHIEEIHRVANQAAAISRQLLGFARMQAARTEVLDPNQAVRELAPMLQRMLEGRALVLELGEVWPIRIDRAQLAQIFLNLVTNARDAGGGLTIRTERRETEAGRRVCFTFVDDGRGMSPEVLARAFDPFFSTKSRGGGIGLGLATVYGIVRQHEGVVDARSEPQVGTRIAMEFPAAGEHVEAVAPPAPPVGTSGPGTPRTIVVAEDEPMVAALTRRILTHAGYSVHVAPDGRDALELIRKEGGRVDLVVSDVVMPHLGGLELVKILATERPDLPVLLASGYPEDERRQSDEILARTPFLPKPFQARELLAAVEGLLTRVARTSP